MSKIDKESPIDLAAEDPEAMARKFDAVGSVQEIAAKLHSNTRTGLTDDQARLNRQIYGSNRLPDKELKSFLEHLQDTLEDVTIIILCIGAFISIMIGVWQGETSELVQGFAIVAAVCIVSGVGAVQNWKQDKEFQSLNKFKQDRSVVVVRQGTERVRYSCTWKIYSCIFIYEQSSWSWVWNASLRSEALAIIHKIYRKFQFTTLLLVTF